MQNALVKIQKMLMQPEVKKAGKEQIKEKARESILEKLAKGKVDADRDNLERWERDISGNEDGFVELAEEECSQLELPKE